MHKPEKENLISARSYITSLILDPRKLIHYLIWKINAREIMRMKDMLVNIYSEQTGQKPEKIVNDIDRDNIMTAEQSVKYGLADEVIEKRQ